VFSVLRRGGKRRDLSLGEKLDVLKKHDDPTRTSVSWCKLNVSQSSFGTTVKSRQEIGKASPANERVQIAKEKGPVNGSKSERLRETAVHKRERKRRPGCRATGTSWSRRTREQNGQKHIYRFIRGPFVSLSLIRSLECSGVPKRVQQAGLLPHVICVRVRIRAWTCACLYTVYAFRIELMRLLFDNENVYSSRYTVRSFPRYYCYCFGESNTHTHSIFRPSDACARICMYSIREAGVVRGPRSTVKRLVRGFFMCKYEIFSQRYKLTVHLLNYDKIVRKLFRLSPMNRIHFKYPRVHTNYIYILRKKKQFNARNKSSEQTFNTC